MKFHKHKPEYIIRVIIRRQGEANQYISLCDTTPEEVEAEFKAILKPYLTDNPFASGKKTSIEIREAIGAKNMKSRSFSFHGLTVTEVHKILIDKIQKNE